MLTENVGREASESSTQHKYQQKMEEYLETKAQSMLDGVLGYGKAIVRVTADLSFEQVEETREMYDPENQIIRSEERIENTSTAPDTSSSAQEHIITNYEMNRTIQSIIKDVGVVDRLNVAVLVDGTYETNAEGTKEYQPRTVEEMQRLENIVKAAVGYATERGDQFEISNIQFDMSQFEEQERQMAELERRQFWQDIINKGLSVGLILFFLLLLRRVVKRSKVIIGDMPFAGNGEMGDDDVIGQKREDLEIEMSEEVTEHAQIQDSIKKFTDKNPVQVTNLLRTWLVEK
jgi:flagellar M-ring protein FliF